MLALLGFGPIVTAVFLSQAGSGKQLSNGRQLSARCGLVPRQLSSVGKVRLGKITKNELRLLLIHGVRSVSKYIPERNNALSRWFKTLVLRSGKEKVIVALAKKLMRIAWGLLLQTMNLKRAVLLKQYNEIKHPVQINIF